MNKIKWTLISVITAYIALFFLWAPLYMGALELQWYRLSKLTYTFYSVAYEPIIIFIDNDNIIHVAYNNNKAFWCGLFSTCTVK